jgi:hypothetical protein
MEIPYRPKEVPFSRRLWPMFNTNPSENAHQVGMCGLRICPPHDLAAGDIAQIVNRQGTAPSVMRALRNAAARPRDTDG